MKIKLIDFLKQQNIKIPQDRPRTGSVLAIYHNVGYNQANAEWSNIEVEVPEKLDFLKIESRELIEEFPEINTNNYNHDDVINLNFWATQVYAKFGQRKEKRK